MLRTFPVTDYRMDPGGTGTRVWVNSATAGCGACLDPWFGGT